MNPKRLNALIRMAVVAFVSALVIPLILLMTGKELVPRIIVAQATLLALLAYCSDPENT